MSQLARQDKEGEFLKKKESASNSILIKCAETFILLKKISIAKIYTT